MNIKLLLVDEHHLFRRGMASLLAQDSDFKIVADLDNSKEVMRHLAREEPDIVLMDLRSHGIAGLDTILQIKRRSSQTRVVLLTTLRAEEYVRYALRAGVDGYILKDAGVSELTMALRSVAAGKKYLSPDVSGHVVESFLHPEHALERTSRIDQLTQRERGVLQLIAEGRTNRSAADFLCGSSKTVEKHRSNLMQKLGLSNATELTLAAIVMGLIEVPPAIARMLGDDCAKCDVAGLRIAALGHQPVSFCHSPSTPSVLP
jgi:DNA-binding NarL/FixJ family response regulator